MGHARAIINISNVDTQLQILQAIITKNLSVRDVERIVKELNGQVLPPSKKIKPMFKNELAKEYGMSYSTFMRNFYKSRQFYEEIKENGYYISQKILNIKQVEIIFKHMGTPESYSKD